MNYEAITAAEFRAEAARLGLDARAVERPADAGRPPGHGDPRALRRSAERAPTAVLATHESIAAALYADLAELGLRVGVRRLGDLHLPVGRDPRARPAAHAISTPTSMRSASALAEQLIALQPDAPTGAVPRAATLVPLRFAPRASHGRPARKVTA